MASEIFTLHLEHLQEVDIKRIEIVGQTEAVDEVADNMADIIGTSISEYVEEEGLSAVVSVVNEKDNGEEEMIPK